jgi:hypothetical protein
MNQFEKSMENMEIAPNENVRVIASLEDRYFIKSESGKIYYLDQTLAHYEEVSEDMVASAILKHGYKPIVEGALFKFSEREAVLNKPDEK